MSWWWYKVKTSLALLHRTLSGHTPMLHHAPSCPLMPAHSHRKSNNSNSIPTYAAFPPPSSPLPAGSHPSVPCTVDFSAFLKHC